MKKKKLIAILLNCCMVILLLISYKETAAAVKINEIYPAPPAGESEWVEFYNDGSSSADLSNYFFDDDTDFDSDNGSSTKIGLLGFLATQMTCFLDLSNYLDNSGDTPSLFNTDEVLVDYYSYPKTTINKSYSRIPDGEEWQTDQTPTKSSNRCSDLISTSTPTPTLTLTPTLTPIATNNPQPSLTPTIVPISTPTQTLTPSITPTPTSHDNIYLSETMVYPQTGEHEWVEIYNDNDYIVSLQNWYLDDVENAGSSIKTFSLDISPKGYGVIELTSSMFNNDGDSLRLLDFNKLLKDSFEYLNPIKGKTYGRNSLTTDEFCLQEPTKNAPNNPCSYPTNTLSPSLISTPMVTKIATSTTTSIPSPPLVNAKTVYQTTKQTELNDDTNVENLLTERGVVLSAKIGDKIVEGKMIAYVKGFSTSSFFISLLNIFYIMHKIMRKLNNNETI